MRDKAAYASAASPLSGKERRWVDDALRGKFDGAPLVRRDPKSYRTNAAKLFLTGAIARQIEEDAYEAASFPPPSDPSPSEKKANAAKKSLAQLAKALTPGGTGEEGSKKKKKGEKWWWK